MLTSILIGGVIVNNSNLHRAAIDAKAEIIKNIDDFEATLATGSSGSSPIISIAEIEKTWSDLKNKTTKTYSDMIAAYLSDLSEADIIKSKKVIIPERG